ncbi:MAG: UDP-N-acetylmuramoyl-L-alanine--D-glutamate ligase [Alphaproteobacteria bacterium]|nr:UDP-N-acetylmuramoyl-L-alanine--D-glutamate ligase [Alphaproteobacteria bacterium]|tara:strand:- start:522868 stop:524265 length:1398 start_codon:yes stop_codon:yes gene_type:complete
MSSLLANLEGKKYAVLGLGRTGLATARALKKAKIDVLVWDDHEEAREAAKRARLELCDFENDGDFKGLEALVLSPGIPHKYPQPHPIVERALHKDIPVISDIEVLRQCDPETPLVAITGTNGKSTTTALIGHILSTQRDTQIGGNIGVPVMDLKRPKKDGAYVLELSSYQLELTPSLKPQVSVLLNITPDHLSRHGGLDGYIAAKKQIFASTADGVQSIAVICIDDEHTVKIADEIRALENWQVVTVAAMSDRAADITVRGGILTDNRAEMTIDLNKNNRMQGAHNHQNAAAAYAALHYGFDMDAKSFEKAYNKFGGLNHRQFLVRTINGVPYINDSKATNANASARALASMKNVYWIVGGQPKEGGLDGLDDYADRIRHAFLIGESVDDFAKWMQLNNIEYDISHTVDIAVAQAHQMAQNRRGAPGGAGTVLLSPACASFDQFTSFEARGDHFEALVNALEDDV